MRILADCQILGVEEDFSPFGALRLCDSRELGAALPEETDVALVRAVTRVDAAWLGAARPFFIGSATSGVDHIDAALLARRGIHFAHAPGCNARAVAEYVLSCLSVAALRRGAPLETLKVGIVGCGHIGSLLYRLLRACGVDCLLNDPPLQASMRPRPPAHLPAAALPGLTRAEFKPLEALCKADAITLHVPLTEHGEHPTRGLLGEDFLRRCKEDVVLINTARGAVLDERALA